MTAPVKPQEPTNYELLGKGWATRAPFAQTLQSVLKERKLRIAGVKYMLSTQEITTGSSCVYLYLYYSTY